MFVRFVDTIPKNWPQIMLLSLIPIFELRNVALILNINLSINKNRGMYVGYLYKKMFGFSFFKLSIIIPYR